MEARKRNLNEITPEELMMKFKSKHDFYLYLTQQVSVIIYFPNSLSIVTILHSSWEPHQQGVFEVVIRWRQESV